MQIGVLGPLEVRGDDGSPVEISGGRLRALLILLALRPGQLVPARTLIEALWDGEPPAGATNALQALISRLRRVLPAEATIESQAAGYRLVGSSDVDSSRFEALVGAGRAAARAGQPARAEALLGEALALWRGPALDDVADSALAQAPVAKLTELRLSAIEERAEAMLAGDGESVGLVAELEALAVEHPLREGLTRQLMRALCAAGRPAEALAAFERTRSALAERLGADPAPALAELHLAILRADSSTVERPVRSTIRAGLTSFVGRDEEVAAVGKLLTEARLTTLTGPGGAGKTRLATEVARNAAGQLADEVWLVELAPIVDPDEVPAAVLAALGLRVQALFQRRGQAAESEPVEHVDRLVSGLRGKRALLVLDNCEHLIAAAASLADRLLGDCPQLRVLATSREPLAITGESLWPVEPLALPPADVTAGEAVEYASVRLLADRAAAVRPGFAVVDGNVAAVARICRALDGMPLAIELAAARLRSMTPEQVAARLDDRFRLLTQGSRTALARHQTLRGVVDWSWELLDDAEKALLRRLAMFAGGATLTAVERICAGPSLPAADVFDRLNALVDKSLVQVDSDRYTMLETIKAYGLERLMEAGEPPVLCAAHVAYFVELAEAAEPHLRTGEQLTWLHRLVDDHENLHLAMRRAVTAGDALSANRLAAALGWYWWLRGHRLEGAELAAEAFDLPGDVPAETGALAFTFAALNGLSHGHRDLARSKEWLITGIGLANGPDSAHPLLRLMNALTAAFVFPDDVDANTVLAAFAVRFEDPDPWVRAAAHSFHGHGRFNEGHDAEAEQDFLLAIAEFRSVGERWGISFSLTALAELVSLRGDHRQAADYLAEALERVSELGTNEDMTQLLTQYSHHLRLVGEWERAEQVLADAERTAARVGMPEHTAGIEYERGEIARYQRDLPAAERHLRRTEELMASWTGAPQFHAMIHSSLGFVATEAGDRAVAGTRHVLALTAALASRDRPVQRRIIANIAHFALRGGDPEAAAALLGAAADLDGNPYATRPDAPEVTAAARDALGETLFAEAYQRGRESSIVDLVAQVGLRLDA